MAISRIRWFCLLELVCSCPVSRAVILQATTLAVWLLCLQFFDFLKYIRFVAFHRSAIFGGASIFSSMAAPLSSTARQAVKEEDEGNINIASSGQVRIEQYYKDVRNEVQRLKDLMKSQRATGRAQPPRPPPVRHNNHFLLSVKACRLGIVLILCFACVSGMCEALKLSMSVS